MAQERLTLRKIREILRLKHEAGLSNRAIAGACKISNSTVGEYLRRAEAAGVSWPLPEEGEEELYRKLFPEKGRLSEKKYPVADWHARLPDPTIADAILDRTIHSAYRVPLEGDSQRKLRGFRTMSNT